MVEWLSQLFSLEHFTWRGVLIGASIFVVTFTGSIAMVSYLLVKLPPNYFHSSHERDFWTDRHQAVRWGGLIVKNIAGAVLVLLGIVMSLPGVPGQGLLTILLGVMLLDFPGKRRLEQKLLSRPRVLQTINQLRGRFGKPPLVID